MKYSNCSLAAFEAILALQILKGTINWPFETLTICKKEIIVFGISSRVPIYRKFFQFFNVL